MASGSKRYALGDLGKLYEFQGGEVPEGTTALVEEKSESLTQAGKEYCEKRRRPVNIETLQVLFAQQSSSAVTDAAVASVKNQDARPQRDERTKSMSERLRHDWAAQDKAYKAAEAGRK
ncbi:MAG: hypothetical protein JSU59_05680 [Nitrospirota bacterium]|nr:MAG: hypothetical protein JSU59_05680 [Nitrospirota bacterium]